jgi:hypothetical protein
MTKHKKIARNLGEDKELQKNLGKLNHYSVDSFIQDADRYIKAIQEERMACIIRSVSSSGMSRNIWFFAPQKSKTDKRYYFTQFYALFTALGYTATNDRDSFRIGGCGMDMIFHTNYSIIHRLGRMGFLNKKQVEILAQKTPRVM